MNTHAPHPSIVARRLIALYGGVEKTRETLEQQYREIADRWNQDSGLMGKILRAHLFVEHYLSEYLLAENPKLGSVDKARLSFAQKLALAQRDGSAEAYLFPGIRHLNRVRNRLAHTLKAEVTEADRDVFLSISLFTALREALAARNSPSLEPIDVLEDFARHAGMTLAASANPDKGIWTQAISGQGRTSDGSAT